MNEKKLQNLVPDKKLDKQYYLDQLTLLLKNDFGVPKQIAIFDEYLNMLNNKELDLFSTLGKYDETSGEWHINMDAIGKDGYESDLLDKIASIVGVSRHYDFLDEKGLTNGELYLLIEMQIFKNNYHGTKAEADEIYSKISELDPNMEITYATDTASSAPVCLVYLNSDKAQDKNLITLFNKGLFDFNSLGIKYNRYLVSYGHLAFWDGYPYIDDNGNIAYRGVPAHNYWNQMKWG